MSSFAPVYRPSTSQQSFLTRERKRKRSALHDGDEPEISSASETEEDAPRVLHPVNKTDPYYVAGHQREKPLPGGNFPHAAVKETREPQPPVEEELSRLNPPVYAPKIAQTDHAGSLRARHLDNLTAILHQCMLKDDWERASRAWGLILRTEIAGHGVDVRRHGRWTIGAEILMRRNQIPERIAVRRSSVDHIDENDERSASVVPAMNDESIRRAREYYERLIVQYPHHQRTHHSATNALAIHPARFSLWIYHVQDKSKRERQTIITYPDSSNIDYNMSPDNSDRSGHSTSQRQKLRHVRSEELKEALEIARRLDELLVSPPYDSNHEMLYLRGMVALWLYDLQLEHGHTPPEDGTSEDGDTDLSIGRVSPHQATPQAQAQQRRARKIFRKLRAADMKLPPNILAFLDEYEEDGSE